MMASRKEDKIACGAVISSGSDKVFIAGQAATAPGISIEEDVPEWATNTLTYMLWGGLIATGVGEIYGCVLLGLQQVVGLFFR